MQPFDPRQYLNLARVLAGQPDDEAAFRSAVSRAYYAAFLAARPVARKHEIYYGSAGKVGQVGRRVEEPPTDRHKRFWADLRCKLNRVGEIGNDLRIWRNHADYDLDIDPPEGWSGCAKKWVGRAEVLFRELDRAEEAARVAKLVKEREEAARVADWQKRVKRYYGESAAPTPGHPGPVRQ